MSKKIKIVCIISAVVVLGVIGIMAVSHHHGDGRRGFHHDGYCCGHAEHAGKKDAVRLTEWAIRLYDIAGRDAALRLLNAPEAVFGDRYAFVIDPETGIILANPFATDLVGTDISDLTDESGVRYGQEIRNAGRRGDWVSYMFGDPLTDGERQKHSFVKRYDGLVFGSGYYGDGADSFPEKRYGKHGKYSESPCGMKGYALRGDICERVPAGHSETRTPCEVAADSRESAGVEQDYQHELEKCREQERESN